MWWYNKLIFTFVLVAICTPSVGQDCNFSISGSIVDEHTGHALPYSTVYIEELSTGAVADSNGTFTIDKLCPNSYHLRVSHVGCEGKTLFLSLEKDTVINVSLHHHKELMNEIEVHGKAGGQSPTVSSTISSDELKSLSNKNLADIVGSVSGVTVMKTGSNVSKPIIHGLSGNRISVINNGISQAGQRWGNDHGLEIDPFSADHISIIKGAASLEYGGNGIGGVVLVDSKHIPKEPHLHGDVNYIYDTNGKGHTINARVQKHSKLFAWRVAGTLKDAGIKTTPSYYLANTAKKEKNLSTTLEKDLSKRIRTSLHYSIFNTELGILSGSHIGNLTDLEAALQQEEPFNTPEDFSREINAPKQEVIHHLLKSATRFEFNSENSVNLTYAIQNNQRQEFDIRRGNRSEIPSLSLYQRQQYAELKYAREKRNWFHKVGVQYKNTYNLNDVETGISPLIPNYKSSLYTLYAIDQYKKQKLTIEYGARIEALNLDVYTSAISNPGKTEHYQHQYLNKYFSLGGKWSPSHNYTIQFTNGFGSRAPEVNELYSQGLHQGVGGIEEGNRNLIPETSLKSVLSADIHFGEMLFLQLGVFSHYFADYIYLVPQSEYRLTIRGAFPVFKYQQTDALLLGYDALISLEPSEKMKLTGKVSYVQGEDFINNSPLINIPPISTSLRFSYTFSGNSWLENPSLFIETEYIGKQTRYEEGQDFVAPPSSYNLLSAGLQSIFHWGKREITFGIQGNNLLNHSYRNYLNRQRYFALEAGRNISFNLRVSF